MLDITQRPATDKDIEFARQAHHKGYYDTVTKQFGLWDKADQDKRFEEGWKAAPHSILLCDGKPCGYVSVEQAPDYEHVRELVVHPDYKGKGIGTIFLQGIIDSAKKRNVPVKLGVLLENSAFDFYRKHGFVEYDRTETQILMQFTPPQT